MPRMYDFGADYSSVSVNERRAIAWPVAVWSCYIPESETQKINILESLILQLVHKGFSNPKETLCNTVGFNKDLVEAAIESCKTQGFFDWRFKELRLAETGKAVLGKIENPYAADLEASQKTKRIYMIQDLVTKSVVPIFDIDKLPDMYFEDESVLKIQYKEVYGKNGNMLKPKSASVKTALRYWSRLCYNIRHGIVCEKNTLDFSALPKADEDIEDFIPFEDEVEWDSVEEDGSVAEEKITFADKEVKESQQKQDKEVEKLTILDDCPEIYYARGFIAINRSEPDEIITISPFGSRLDDWFRTVINRLRVSDAKFDEEIQFFLELKREELKDVVAFDNDFHIELFERFPFISNNREYADLKRAIENLYRTKERIVEGNDETHNYTENRATALQIALRHIFDSHPEMLKENMGYKDYEMAIKGLVDSYGFSDDVIRKYLPYDKSIFNNMRKCKVGNGHITGYSALILVDAWTNKTGKSLDLLKAMPEFTDMIYEITRPRNTSTHGNKGKNGKEGYADMYVSCDAAVKGYKNFEQLIVALYARYMEV